MKLQEKDAVILERLRIGMNQKQISEELNLSTYLVGIIVNRLTGMSAVQKLKNGQYKVLIDTYEITNEALDRPRRMNVHIPEGYDEYIRGHYGVIPRREIARRLKLDKVTLNQMIIQLGIGGNSA